MNSEFVAYQHITKQIELPNWSDILVQVARKGVDIKQWDK